MVALFSVIQHGRTPQLQVADALLTTSAPALGVKGLTLPKQPPRYTLGAPTALVRRLFVEPARKRGGARILLPGDADALVRGAERHIRQAGRDRILQAVRENHGITGWARMGTGAENCPFCDLLISRGAVYRSLSTASFTSHDGCDCIAVPVSNRDEWAGKAHADELYAQYRKVTQGYSGADAINAWRRYRESLNSTPSSV